jgi:hypothetical protein
VTKVNHRRTTKTRVFQQTLDRFELLRLDWQSAQSFARRRENRVDDGRRDYRCTRLSDAAGFCVDGRNIGVVAAFRI